MCFLKISLASLLHFSVLLSVGPFCYIEIQQKAMKSVIVKSKTVKDIAVTMATGCRRIGICL